MARSSGRVEALGTGVSRFRWTRSRRSGGSGYEWTVIGRQTRARRLGRATNVDIRFQLIAAATSGLKTQMRQREAGLDSGLRCTRSRMAPDRLYFIARSLSR